jgi:fermentation-respiration switch protein FrsA (DUF1100 family)
MDGAGVLRTGAALSLLLLSGCAGLASRPGVFDASRREIVVGGRTYHPTYVKPLASAPENLLVAFFTGDAGWMGTSGMLFSHLAEAGYPLAGFDSREALKPIKKSGEAVSVSEAADSIEQEIGRAKTDLGLEPGTPVLVIGFSRGASLVAFTAVQPRLHAGLAGAVAVALTRETDYLKAPNPVDRPPEIQVDEKGRMQLYPALALIGSIPLAVIQSTGDRYVPAAESRRLLGPDTPTRRLYEIEARNHGFSGADAALLGALDDALRWIERPEP